ncbi:chemotaxis protein [Myxococcus xanthus]|uniref:methyl-accepting chemotaxis protein n=1 Tax=Myxococcus xanthus TaxID=34 RepID=UPI001916DF8F|nr:methyl-accepting chemotaxis protein [Myxococcus xanthus]QQR46486.1 chemotaxis protein [Myxococcus xanthus]
MDASMRHIRIPTHAPAIHAVSGVSPVSPAGACMSSRRTSWCWVLPFLLILSTSAWADTGRPSIDLNQGWRYRWGDSPPGPADVPAWALESGDEQAWQPVAALREPPGRGAHTVLWLSIPVPQGQWLEPALYLGTVANAFEVYANGHRIHASGRLNPSGNEETDNLAWRLVPLPPTVEGSRLLLRIQSSGPIIGVGGAARVGAHHQLLATVTRTGLAPFVMGMLLLTIASAAALGALVRRQTQMLLPLVIFTSGSAALLLGTSGLIPALWGHYLLGSQLTLVGSHCILPALAWFISDSVLENRMRWFRWSAWAACVPASLQVIIVMADLGMAQRNLGLFVLYSVPCLLGCVIVAGISAWRGNPDARIFSMGLGVFFGVVIHTTLPVFGLAEATDSLMHWGFLALTLSLVGIVVRRAVLVVRALASHTHQLEERRHEVKRLAQDMGSGAGELAAVAQQLRTSSEVQTAGVSRQAAALREAEQTVQEIRQGSLVTANKARQLAGSIETAEEAGRDGGAAITHTLTNLEAIRQEVSEMSSHILALDARTREISSIVDTVKGLADQSNMLAINAAIEAARSGEHGRGFGVVSREVRSLADQSILATHRIREVLDGVSLSMREAAKRSEQGEQRVKASLDAVRVSGTQLQRLTGIIDDTGTSVRQISAAVAQQDAGTSQIAQAIQELSAQMRHTLRTAEETQKVSGSVQALAENMAGTARIALQAGTLDD